MDIAAWLSGLGLPQYQEAFQKNAVDAEVLPELTADDLKDLGVDLVGHRRKLLAAIAALRADDAIAEESTMLPASGRQLPPSAERRQLTVMFCDLVGSTALAARRDPEELRDILGAYHACVSQLVAEFKGFVAKYMGDGVLIYFGYPQAHEDDPEQAVRAGLALVEGIGRLDTAGEMLEIRVAIATGLVVVGDLIGSGEAQERGVVGETPNLAARLQGMAPANGVLIAEGTRRLVGDLFEYRDLGAIEVRGFDDAVPVWHVLRSSAAESRFEALRASALTPLIGREEEIELLLRRWQRAKSGEGQVVLISGEPGIGKSRLTAALRERLEGEPYTRLSYFCSPHHQDSALHPFIAQLERAAGFEREDQPGTRLDKLEALLAPASPPSDDVVLLAELLSLPTTGRYPKVVLSPQRKRERTFEALLGQLVGLARRQTILIIVEDVHWIDPSSRELFDLAVDRAVGLPVLLVFTFRPEFHAPWNGLPQVTALTLNRFDPRAGAMMVERIAGNQALPSEVTAKIVERTDGIPLFVEELTKAVLEARARDGRIETTPAGAPPPSAAVPAALDASLMARLDRLGLAAKEVAQIGAVIGREFAYELLAPVAQRSDTELRDALDRLTDAGLVFRRGTPPRATFQFKHALVRDAAYNSLLRSRRQHLHAGITATLEAQFPEIVAAQPELLAHHFTEAGLAEQAVECHRRAAERAIERSANPEAIAHLARGLELLTTLPETPQRDKQELMFQVALVAPHWASKGYASQGTERAATRALELCRQVGTDTPEHFQVLWALAAFYMVRGELRTGWRLGEQCLQLAERQQDPGLLGYAHFLMGDLLFWFGELMAARAHLEQGIALYDLERDRAAASRYGFDYGMACHSFLGRVLWHLGYPDQGVTHSEKAIAIADEVSHSFSKAQAISWAAALHQLRREVKRTQELADEDLALTTEQIFPFFAAHAMILRGWALVEQGQGGDGIARLREGLTAYRATGAEIERSHWLGLMAEACGKTGQIEKGLRVVSEGVVEIQQNGIRYYEAELNRLEGELRLSLDPADESRAEACFRRAIEIARAQQAQSFELRAAMSLGRLWLRQNKREDARGLLAPLYGWFTEGFDTADLIAAKALLAELS